MVDPVPEGYNTLSAYIHVNGAAAAIDFYKRAFGATERMRLPMPGGRIGHAELQFGDSILMLADEMPEMGIHAPQPGSPNPITLSLYVDDVDAVYQRALDAGATVKQPLENRFYGDRTGSLVDPFGHEWSMSTHIEDVSPDEMNRRMAETMA